MSMFNVDTVGEFLQNNWGYLLGFVLMSAIVGITLRMLSDARTHSVKVLDELLVSNVDLYLQRLRDNRRLRWVFRKSVIEFMMLKGYIAKGDENNALQCIENLDKMKLEPQEKLEFLETRLSFFAQRNSAEQAVASRDMLVDFLKRLKADKTEKYREIIAEADAIVKVYIEKDVGFIDNLKQKASVTAHPVVRGVTQYRIARLAYHKGDEQLTKKYLLRAAKNLKGTTFEATIDSALRDNSVLNQ